MVVNKLVVLETHELGGLSTLNSFLSNHTARRHVSTLNFSHASAKQWDLFSPIDNYIKYPFGTQLRFEA